MSHIYSKYTELDGNSRTCGPEWEDVVQWEWLRKHTIKFYRHKGGEFA